MNRYLRWATHPWALGLAALLMVYSLIGFSLVPFLVQHDTPKLAAEYVKRPAAVREVQFNPYTFAFEAKGLTLTEADGRPLVALDRLYLNVDPLGLISRGAWVVADLVLDRPAVHVVQNPSGEINLLAIKDSLPKATEPEPPPSDEPPPSFILDHFQINGGEASFTDQTVPEPFTENMAGIDLELKGLSTLPDREGRQELTAELPSGGKLAWHGSTSLNPIASSGDLELAGFDLGPRWELIRHRLDLAPPKGVIDTGLSYRFAYAKGQAELDVKDFRFKLAGLNLATADQPHPLANLEEFVIDKASLQLPAQTLDIPSIAIRKGDIRAAVDAAGRLDWLNLVRPALAKAPPSPAAAGSAPATPPKAPATPWKLRLGSLQVSELGLHYADAARKLPFAFDVAALGLELAAETEAGDGPPKGHVDGIGFHLDKIALAAQNGPVLLNLDEAGFTGGTVDLSAQTVKLPEFLIRRGGIRAGVDQAGQMDWLALLEPVSGTAAAEKQGVGSGNGGATVTPAAAPAPATLAGTTVAPAGSTSPAASPPWKLAVDKFRIAEIGLDFADASKKFPFALAVGDFGLDLRAEAEVGASAPKARVDGMNLHLNRIALARGGKVEMMRLEEIGFDQASLELAGQTVKVPAFRIRKGKVNAAIDDRGQIDWLALTEPAPPIPAAASGAATPAPGVAPARAALTRTASRPARPAGQNGKSAPATPAPAVPVWKLAVDRFSLAEISLNAEDGSRKVPLTVAVGDFGLDFSLAAEAGAGEPSARVDKLGVRVNRVAVAQPGKPKPLVGWDSFTLDGGQVDSAKRSLALQRAALKGGGTAIQRDPDGSLKPLADLEPLHPVPPVTPAKAPAHSRVEAPWSVKLGEFTLQGFGVGYTDLGFTPKVAYDLDDLQLTARNIGTDGRVPVRFDTRFKVRQGGNVQVSGTASPTGDQTTAKVKVDRLDLKQLQAFVDRYAFLALKEAAVSTDMDVSFQKDTPKPHIKATGTFGITDMRLTQTRDQKTFLAWRDLAVSGIRFSMAPDNLAVKEVRIGKPEATVDIAKDRSTNLSGLFKTAAPPAAARAAADKPATGSAPAQAKPGKPAAVERPFPVAIERVRLDDGRVDFSDMSLLLPFAATINDFGGDVSGISLTPTAKAKLQFTGRVNQYGEAKVSGSLTPMAFKDYSDIAVIFNNVEMSSLSPYSATFAGRKISGGKLNLDLLYKIVHNQLQSQNKIMLQDFTLGERVETAKALDLPLDLAISLLTDSEGRINVAVPITGSLDDPKFAVGPVMWDALATIVKNLVTAPFAAIGAAFGASPEEKLDAVLFQPGLATLAPPEREKLHKIAAGLGSRPQLKLTIHPQYDPKLDGEAMKSLKVRTALAEEREVALQPGEDPGPLAFGDGLVQRALEKLADARDGNLADSVATAYLKDTGKAAQRIGAMAALAGKASPTPDFYERLFQALVERAALGQAELEALAERRGSVIDEELTRKSRLDRARVVLAKPEKADGKDGNAAVRLELGSI